MWRRLKTKLCRTQLDRMDSPLSFNPYEAPAPIPQAAVGVVSGTRADLRSVAMYQRGIIACISLYILIFVAQISITSQRVPQLPVGVALLLALATLGVIVAGAAFVFLLSIKVYGPALGALLGVLSLIPCLGVLALLRVNAKATTVLQENGIKVGWFGASASTIPL